jgi:hypothetical protein
MNNISYLNKIDKIVLRTVTPPKPVPSPVETRLGE